jgi:DNA-binding response OmpR family regulator
MSECVQVLVLDDDQYFRGYVCALLEDAGYKTLQARTCKEAGLIMGEQRPDLAVVDYRLPSSDGVSWIQVLRESGVDIPVVLVSGQSLDRTNLNRVRNLLNVSLILRKPIDPQFFVQQIRLLVPPHDESFVQDLTDVPSVSTVCDELEELRLEYKVQLQEELHELQSRLLSFLNCLNKSALEDARNIAHRIRGTSGCFGLAETSEEAGKMEDFLELLQKHLSDLTLMVVPHEEETVRNHVPHEDDTLRCDVPHEEDTVSHDDCVPARFEELISGRC